jgi:hypothetical protein
MLRSPRRLPQRYNRRVTPQMRDFAKRRQRHRKELILRKWSKLWRRMQRKGENAREVSVKLAPWILGTVAVILTGSFLFSPIFTVKEIRIARNDARVDIERAQRLLRPLFGRHLFFLSSQEVLPLLENGLPPTADRPAESGIIDLQNVEVSKRYPATLQLRLTLDPLYSRIRFVQSTASVVAATGAITADFITSEGVYVAYTPDQVGSGMLLPLLTVTDWKDPPQPFSQVVQPELLKSMQHAEQALLQQFGQVVRSRTVYLRAQEFHLQTPEFSLWMDSRTPLDAQLMRYRIFLQSAGKAAAKEYVDLRLTDRVVYK